MKLEKRINQIFSNTHSTEVCSDSALKLTGGSREVLSALDSGTDVRIDGLPIWASIHCPCAQERKRIVFCTSIVDNNIPNGGLIQLLSKIDVDPQKVWIHLSSFDFLQQALEPTKAWCVSADPEEFNTSQCAKFSSLLSIPNVLQDTGKWCDTDTSTNEDCNFRVEDIFSWSTIGTIDTDNRKRTSSRIRIEFNEFTTARERTTLFVLFISLHSCLSDASDNRARGSNTFAEGTSEVTNLTNMDRDIWVLRSRGDSERMPLESGDVRNLEEEPLTSGVLERRLDHAEFHSTRWVNKHFGKLGSAASADFTIDTFTEVDDTGPNDITPGEISDADMWIVEGERVCKCWKG